MTDLKKLAEFYRKGAGNALNEELYSISAVYDQTASLLESLIPRTEPPTVGGYVLHYAKSKQGTFNAEIESAENTRLFWQDGDRWLPLPKIEEGA